MLSMGKQKVCQLDAVSVAPSTDSTDYLRSLYQRMGKLYNIECCRVLLAKTLLLKKWTKILHIHWVEFLCVRRPRVFFYPSFIITIATLLGLKKLLRVKIVVTLHNVIPHETFSWPLEYAFFKTVLSFADRILVHSDQAVKITKLLYNIPPAAIVKMFHPSWIEVYEDSVPKKRARDLLKIPYESFVFGFFGDIREYKGLHLLMKAFQRLRIENTRLVVAGAANPRYLNELHQVLRNDAFLTSHVLMTPRRVDCDDVQVYIKACDVGVIPYTETFSPACLLLFMSFGVPVVAPKLPAVVEYCPRDATFFFKPNDCTDLQRKMELAVNSIGRLQEFGLYAQTAVGKFNWATLAAATYKLYRQLLTSQDQ